MSELKKFGERVAQERREKSARERRDVLQSEIADAIGTTPTSVGRWEAGLVMPKDAMLVKLAHYFGVTPAWLRYGQEPRTYPVRQASEPPVLPSIAAGPMNGERARQIQKEIDAKRGKTTGKRSNRQA